MLFSDARCPKETNMRSGFNLAILASTMFVLSGCALCPPGYLDDYAAVGGKWQRTDPASGRVGSVFSDPGTSVSTGISTGTTYYDGDTYYEQEIYESDGYETIQGDDYYEEVSPQSVSPETSSVIESESEYYEESASRSNDGVIILGENW